MTKSIQNYPSFKEVRKNVTDLYTPAESSFDNTGCLQKKVNSIGIPAAFTGCIIYFL